MSVTALARNTSVWKENDSRKGAPPSDVPTYILKPDNQTCVKCHNNESLGGNRKIYRRWQQVGRIQQAFVAISESAEEA